MVLAYWNSSNTKTASPSLFSPDELRESKSSSISNTSSILSAILPEDDSFASRPQSKKAVFPVRPRSWTNLRTTLVFPVPVIPHN